MLKKIAFLILVTTLILIGIIALKTFNTSGKQSLISANPPPILSESALNHFKEAIQFQTISYGNSSQWDSMPFINFRKFLETTYPLVHAKLQREIISGYSYIYKWQGKNESLNPFILMAHQDVVPIEESTIKMWTVAPFSGTVKDGYIWGRGTTDDKINLISILES